MLGLYLALIAAWLWAVLVFAPTRHARTALFLPLYLGVGMALHLIGIVSSLLSRLWVKLWVDAFDKLDQLGKQKGS